MANSEPQSDTDFIARARARMARLNQAADALTTELGLPPEAKYDMLATVFEEGLPATTSQAATDAGVDVPAVLVTPPVPNTGVADALAAARRSVGLVLARTRRDLAAGATYLRHGVDLGPAWETTTGIMGVGGTGATTAEPVRTNSVLLPPETSGESPLIEVRATRPNQDTLVLDVYKRTEASLTLWLFKGILRAGEHRWELVETHSIAAGTSASIDASPAYQRTISRSEFPDGERLEVAPDSDTSA